MEFCVECGAEERLYGHICRSCLLKKELFKAPEHLHLVVCRGCGRVQHGSSWSGTDPSKEVARLLVKETSLHDQVSCIEWRVPDFEPEKGERILECTALITIGEEMLELGHDLKLKVLHQMCQRCSRQSGDYYEAILQLRTSDPGPRASTGGLEEENRTILRLIEIMGEGDETGFLTKAMNVTGGIDYYLGSVALARSVARSLRDSLGAGVTESSSAAGMKDGRELHRWTVLVRLPSVARGDVVALDDEPYQVASLDPRSCTLRHLVTKQEMRVKDLTRLRMIARLEDIEQAVVVSREGSTLQVLDPESMRAVSVLLPPGYDAERESVPVVRFRYSVYLV